MRNWKRVERESHKEKKPVPAHLFDQHQSIIRLCRRNLESAVAASGAMRQYPPISRFA